MLYLGSIKKYTLLIFSLNSFIPGDNFFKPAIYTIEALCAKSYEDTTEKLKEIECKLIAKRTDLRQFEVEYRKVHTFCFFCGVKCGVSLFNFELLVVV